MVPWVQRTRPDWRWSAAARLTARVASIKHYNLYHLDRLRRSMALGHLAASGRESLQLLAENERLQPIHSSS